MTSILNTRTNYDLNNHQRVSGKDLTYFEDGSHERFIPYIIESSVGVGRMLLAVLVDAYHEDEVNGEKRVFLKLKPDLAPYRIAVFPLLKNKPELVEKAKAVYAALKKEFGNVMWDDNGNIGKRYRRQDEIGTPYCVTIDFDTLEDNTVTVRHRDTAEQERVLIDDLSSKMGPLR
jgi:glycyl-tRNA synthetase